MSVGPRGAGSTTAEVAVGPEDSSVVHMSKSKENGAWPQSGAGTGCTAANMSAVTWGAAIMSAVEAHPASDAGQGMAAAYGAWGATLAGTKAMPPMPEWEASVEPKTAFGAGRILARHVGHIVRSIASHWKSMRKV